MGDGKFPDPSPTFADCMAFWSQVWTSEHGGKRLTNRAIARWLLSHGYEVSAPYLSNLRNDRARTPSLRLVGAIAGFFGLSLGEFFSMRRRDEEPIPQTGTVVVTTDPGISNLALRATSLDAGALHAVQEFVQNLVGTDKVADNEEKEAGEASDVDPQVPPGPRENS